MDGRSEIVAQLVEMVTEVVGEDFLLEVEVGPETSFSDDLALESIEFVALAEKVRNRYGPDVDFPAFFASKTIHEISALRVGEMAEYLESVVAARSPVG